MKNTEQIAKSFRTLHWGGNWTGSNMKDLLEGITWQQATTKIDSFNTIAVLVFHINYYISAMIKVFQGGPLDAHDKYSFDLEPITSQEGWDALLQKMWSEAETFATLVEQLPDDVLSQPFVEEKYGTWHRNLHGAIEHTHYHLGQIAILKKLVVTHERTSSH